jgi:uncharacterized protein YbbC (DUF1343 family)
MRLRVLVGSLFLAVACARPVYVGSPVNRVRPGIAVLVTDSLHVIRGRRIALLTNQTGIDENRRSDIDLLSGPAARAAGINLVRLFSPEHGIRGTEDRENVPSGIDPESGLPFHSLYDARTAAPPDSLLRDLDAIVVDLQDIGTRTWTYVGAMLYTLQTAARLQLQVIVLDRPNPITGLHASAPLLDSAIANPWPTAQGRVGKAYALYPMPLRHGMTMGEMARFYDDALGLKAKLVVIPAAGWRRSMWFDETGLPWVKPSPNMPTLASALLYPAIVPFESSNVSVGRGTDDAFQRFGAPWMNAVAVVERLERMRLPGVRFEVDSFTPRAPTDNKYKDRRIPGVHIAITERDRVEAGTMAAAILSALRATSPDSLRIEAAGFDDRFGSKSVREAIMRGEDPLEVMARERLHTLSFTNRVKRYWIYQ